TSDSIQRKRNLRRKLINYELDRNELMEDRQLDRLPEGLTVENNTTDQEYFKEAFNTDHFAVYVVSSHDLADDSEYRCGTYSIVYNSNVIPLHYNQHLGPTDNTIIFDLLAIRDILSLCPLNETLSILTKNAGAFNIFNGNARFLRKQGAGKESVMSVVKELQIQLKARKAETRIIMFSEQRDPWIKRLYTIASKLASTFRIYIHQEKEAYQQSQLQNTPTNNTNDNISCSNAQSEKQYPNPVLPTSSSGTTTSQVQTSSKNNISSDQQDFIPLLPKQSKSTGVSQTDASQVSIVFQPREGSQADAESSSQVESSWSNCAFLTLGQQVSDGSAVNVKEKLQYHRTTTTSPVSPNSAAASVFYSTSPFYGEGNSGEIVDATPSTMNTSDNNNSNTNNYNNILASLSSGIYGSTSPSDNQYHELGKKRMINSLDNLKIGESGNKKPKKNKSADKTTTKDQQVKNVRGNKAILKKLLSLPIPDADRENVFCVGMDFVDICLPIDFTQLDSFGVTLNNLFKFKNHHTRLQNIIDAAYRRHREDQSLTQLRTTSRGSLSDDIEDYTGDETPDISSNTFFSPRKKRANSRTNNEDGDQ
ncbi:hypothetical protein INT45_004932, partial [Circinella minor]